MFTSLYSVYANINRPSTLMWLNVWSYSTNNTWYFLSNELLTFYIESIKGFKSVSISTFQLYPQILYTLVVSSVLLIQLGLLLS